MHAGRHNPNYAYFLDSDYITPNNIVCGLGIVYDSNFCFKHFVNSVVSRAYQRINLIFRAFCSRNLVLMTRVYTTYVRPILEYIGIFQFQFQFQFQLEFQFQYSNIPILEYGHPILYTRLVPLKGYRATLPEDSFRVFTHITIGWLN